MNGLPPEQVTAYLRRLRVNAPGPPTLDTLNSLHLAHLQTVPFENLDIHLGRPIRLERPKVYRKIIVERRGGYCYELNSLFAALLRSLGYGVALLSARVMGQGGTPGPDFDHLALLVSVEGQPYLADVGFGDAFLEPLPLRDGFTRKQGHKTLRLQQHGNRWTYLEDRGEGFQPQYDFTLTPRHLSEFGDMNHWQQTAPDSHFTQNRLCSLVTSTGRISLSGQKLIVTRGRTKTITELSEQQVSEVLEKQFGIPNPPSSKEGRP